MDMTIPVDFTALAGGYIAEQVLSKVILRERENGHRYHAYQKLYSYALVCRAWFKIIAPLMYERAFIYCTTRKIDEPEKTPNRHYEWHSNLGQIMRAGMQDQVKEFRIECEQFSRIFTNCPDLFGKLGMPDTPFVNVTKLWFGGTCHYGAGMEDLFIIPTTRYFVKMFPNVTIVANNRFFDRGKMFDHVMDRIQHHFHNKITNYRIEMDSPRRIPLYFPPNVTKLALQAEILVGYHNRMDFPQIPAAGLRYLNMRNVRTNFNWDVFKSDVPGEIRFTNLEEIHISTDYHPNPISIFSGHDLLTFPRLRIVRTLNILQVYSDMFKLFLHSPIESLQLSEKVAQLNWVDPEIYYMAKHISIHPMYDYTENVDDATSMLMPVLDTPSLVTHASLRMTLREIRLPQSTAWIHLRRLVVTVDKFIVSEAENLISYLPVLEYLRVKYDPPQYQVPHRQARIDEHECPPYDPGRVIHPALQMFEIQTVHDWLNEGDRDRLRYFVRHIPTLIKINVPPGFGRILIQEFAEEGREIMLYQHEKIDERFRQFIDPINM